MGSLPDLTHLEWGEPHLGGFGPNFGHPHYGHQPPMYNMGPQPLFPLPADFIRPRNRQNDRTTFRTSVPKPGNYVHTGNFARFCQRFRQYISLGHMRGNNLHYLLLGMVDEITYAKLEKVILTPEEMTNPELFCARYEQVIYPPGESKALRSELAMIKQSCNESIEDFGFKISEMATKAYINQAMRDEASYTAFIQGIYDISIKTKVHESDVDNFTDAVQLAQRLERVAKSLNSSTTTSTPIFAINETPARQAEAPYRRLDSNNRPPGGSYPRNNGPRDVSNQSRPNQQQTYRRPQNMDGSYRPNRRPFSGNQNRDNSRSYGPQNTRYLRGRCHYCNREGHYMRSCDRLTYDLDAGYTLSELIHNPRQGPRSSPGRGDIDTRRNLNWEGAGPDNVTSSPNRAQ